MSARDQARRDAEFDRLIVAIGARWDDIEPLRQAYELGKRHESENAPAWHDAPTCAGLWINDGEAYDIVMVDGEPLIDLYGTVARSPLPGRWYGPIPADEVKPRGCQACRETGLWHCAHPEDCGNFNEVKP